MASCPAWAPRAAPPPHLGSGPPDWATHQQHRSGRPGLVRELEVMRFTLRRGCVLTKGQRVRLHTSRWLRVVAANGTYHSSTKPVSKSWCWAGGAAEMGCVCVATPGSASFQPSRANSPHQTPSSVFSVPAVTCATF